MTYPPPSVCATVHVVRVGALVALCGRLPTGTVGKANCLHCLRALAA